MRSATLFSPAPRLQGPDREIPDDPVDFILLLRCCAVNARASFSGIADFIRSTHVTSESFQFPVKA
jgi:hypothetical protein